jgi:hypothetical protein
MWIVPVPVAVEGIRVVKVPWMRSFWSRELKIRVSWLIISFFLMCGGWVEMKLLYIVGGLGSHIIRSVLGLVWDEIRKRRTYLY